jgi:hypothetical protein
VSTNYVIAQALELVGLDAGGDMLGGDHGVAMH